jgi:hypothetical protein
LVVFYTEIIEYLHLVWQKFCASTSSALNIPVVTVIFGLGNPNFHEIGNPMTSLIKFWSQTAHIWIALLHYPSGVVHQVSGPEIL